MNVQDIIRNSLVQYDAAQPVIQYLMENCMYDGIKTDSDYVRTKFNFMSIKTKEVLVSTEVETLAIYFDKTNVWSWAWSHPGLLNSENHYAKEILLYSFKLGSELSYIKNILTTSKGVINDPIQIDVNLAISTYIIKKPYIYKFYYKIGQYNLIYFFILLNREKLDELGEKIKTGQI